MAYGSPSTRHTNVVRQGPCPHDREPLVRPVHPARAKERRYQAGFLTSRIVALVAAFSRAEAPNGTLAMRSPVTVAGAVSDSVDQGRRPELPD